MENKYTIEIFNAIQTRPEPVIRVIKSKLSESDINLIGEMAILFNKTIVFGSIHDIIFNKESNVHIVE